MTFEEFYKKCEYRCETSCTYHDSSIGDCCVELCSRYQKCTGSRC